MNINYKAENKENKQLNLEKRNKQNSDIPKPVLYTGLSIAGVAAISIIGKILYDRSQKNDNHNPSSQNKKKTTEINVQENNPKGGPADNYNPNVKITDKNYLMAFKQNDSYCFHNALLQLLACPEIRCKKYGLNNIDKMIGWINKTINENKNKNMMDVVTSKSLSETVDVPENIRLQPEVKFDNPLTGEKIDLTDAPMFDLRSRNVVKQGALSSSKGNAVCFDINAIARSLQDKGKDRSFINIMDDFYSEEYNARLLDLGFTKVCSYVWVKGQEDMIKLSEAYPDIVEGKIENFVACTTASQYNGEYSGISAIKECRTMGYYPTFGVYLVNGHYFNFYLIYDNSQNIKKILWNSGSGFCLSKTQDFDSKFTNGTMYIKFSNKDIVQKYYTEFN